MKEIITRANQPTSVVRAHGYPSLESGNISYPNGRYVVGFQEGNDNSSFELTHRVEGAELIVQAIDHGRVEFVCTVASPISSYRVSYSSKANTQNIQWDVNDLGEPPMFTPMIVVMEPFTMKLDKDQHNVHELWHGRTVVFERGMRLALSDVVALHSSMIHMLLFELDPDKSDGEFLVEPEITEDEFFFRVRLAEDLHKYLQVNSGDASRSHILTHIVSACFSLLHSRSHQHQEDEVELQNYRGLQAIAQTLADHGLPHWSEDEFSPEFAATSLYPHRCNGFSVGFNGE